MKKTTLIAGAFFAATLILGCQSVPENIPDDLDARQLIQLGQDNFDNHHYPAAQKYFNTVLDRFGDDPKHYIEAKYELGHLYMRQKKYRAAYDNFNEILEIYDNVPLGLPGSYKILCGIELAKIPEEKLNEFKRAPKTPQPAPEPAPAPTTAPAQNASPAYEPPKSAEPAPAPTPASTPAQSQAAESEPEPVKESAAPEETADKKPEAETEPAAEEAPASEPASEAE